MYTTSVRDVINNVVPIRKITPTPLVFRDIYIYIYIALLGK